MVGAVSAIGGSPVVDGSIMVVLMQTACLISVSRGREPIANALSVSDCTIDL